MSDEATPPKRPRSRGDLLLNLGLALAVLAAFVAWRRARDPHRLWAQRLTEEHQTQIVRPFTRCFGTARVADIRRITAEVRGGRMPDPFARCHTGPMAELMVAPAGFSDTVRNPPQEVYRLRDRHRSALTRLSSTLRSLEQEVSRCAGNVSDTARRDALVQRLEDMLPELEREERAFEDMILAANEAARLF